LHKEKNVKEAMALSKELKLIKRKNGIYPISMLF
jgi:hypothetical protein